MCVPVSGRTDWYVTGLSSSSTIPHEYHEFKLVCFWTGSHLQTISILFSFNPIYETNQSESCAAVCIMHTTNHNSGHCLKYFVELIYMQMIICLCPQTVATSTAAGLGFFF